MIQIMHRERKEIIRIVRSVARWNSRDSILGIWETDNRNAFLEHRHDYASYPSIV